LVSLRGILVAVRDLGCNVPKDGHADIRTKICIPSSVEQIAQGCFYECNSISTVTFESGSQLSPIAECAFQYCSSLSSIFISSSVDSIDNGCFSFCGSLSTVTFESGSQLSSIANDAFWSCSSLSLICCPSSLQTILANYSAVQKFVRCRAI
jgi:hypothetical protein